nr:hypothetical protein [uncultured Desulfobulbus sp.]
MLYRCSRTHDQMVQAVHSGVQNIDEGSQASATSKKMELKLTQVARASLEELKLDYEDFLRQRRMAQRAKRFASQSLVDQHCTSADEGSTWVTEVAKKTEPDVTDQGVSSGRGPYIRTCKRLCGVPEMLGIGLCSVRLYVNRPITPQIRCPVIAYNPITFAPPRPHCPQEILPQR